MPELPEVESVRRVLTQVIGRRVSSVTLHRRDICTATKGHFVSRASMLLGGTIAALERHGKQLAIIDHLGRVVVVHLGMSGQLRHHRTSEIMERDKHRHASWTLDDESTLVFRDPRRFGGLTLAPDREHLAVLWARLGPDALRVTGAGLRHRIGSSTRFIKAILLDQSVLAGVGNIYADEALFRARLHPLRAGRTLTPAESQHLSRAIRLTLARAIRLGGSTLRDYVTPDGRPGDAQTLHQVYARGGCPCVICNSTLEHIRVTQRTTTFCPRCQPTGSALPRSSR
jgi:formamidopyrimidine-DNA glycosylase